MIAAISEDGGLIDRLADHAAFLYDDETGLPVDGPLTAEEEYLLSSPANRARLRRSLEQTAGKIETSPDD